MVALNLGLSPAEILAISKWEFGIHDPVGALRFRIQHQRFN